MTRTKKQHYISQSILKNFFKTSKIHEINIKSNKEYNCSVSDSMCCSDIYESSLYNDNKLEDAFAQLYDGQFASKLKEIDELLDNGDIKNAKILLRKNFYFYIVSYYKSLASLVRLSKNDSYKLEKNNSTIRMLKLITDVNYMNRLSRIFTNCYNIYVIKSSDDNFIICDQFISTASNFFNGMFTNISNRDIGVKGSMIFLPISTKYYFLLYDKNMNLEYDENLINNLSKDETDKINNIIYNNATEKVAINREYKYIFTNINSYGDEIATLVYSNYVSNSYKKKKEIFYSDFEQEVYSTFSELKWSNYINLGRNEHCFCGSNKKYKNCCLSKVERCKTIMFNIKNNTISNQTVINNYLGVEEHVKL